MIGFDRLGKNGRFGNQMFQYAALKGIAKNNNYDFCIPIGPKTEEGFYHVTVFDGNQKLTSSKMFLTVKERSRPKDPNEKPNEIDNSKKVTQCVCEKGMSDLYDLCIHKRAWTCSEIVPTKDDSKEKENASGPCVDFALIDFKGALEGFYKNQNLWTEKKAFCLSKGFGHPYLEKNDHNKDVESECAF